jgi:hypothetical protein
LTGAKADERQTLLGILNADPTLIHDRPGQTPIGAKNYYGKDFEHTLAAAGIDLLRPARKGEPPRPGAHLFKPLRQTIESINQTFKSQLDLEHHGGHTPAGVIVRVLQRILALTTAIWHNDKTGAPVLRSGGTASPPGCFSRPPPAGAMRSGARERWRRPILPMLPSWAPPPGARRTTDLRWLLPSAGS